MCPHVFWGLVFQSRPPQLLQVQFFVLATNFAFKAAFGAGKAALPFACRTAQCGGQKCGVSLKQSCNSVCRDGEDQTSCVVGVKASVSGVAVTSLAVFSVLPWA